MPKPLVFMMDQMPAILPIDRQYVKNHMWVEPAAARGSQANPQFPIPNPPPPVSNPQSLLFRFGLSAFAVRLLGDVAVVEWSVGPGSDLAAGDVMGSIEGSKASGEILAPAAGRLAAFNLDLLTEPSLLNTNLYDRGWLFTLEGAGGVFLSTEEYIGYLKGCWPIVRRKLAGLPDAVGEDNPGHGTDDAPVDRMRDPPE